MHSLSVLLILTILQPVVRAADWTPHVNLFMGTQNGGNNFPGVARPFGMVKLGPDLLRPGSDAYSGYLPNGAFSGFSMMHEQGTGGAPKYGTVSQLPLVGNVTDPLSGKTIDRAGIDEASVGYYKAQTSEGAVVELSATAHAGIYRYTFPKGSTGHVLVDVSHVLPSFRGQGLGQRYKGGDFAIFADGHYEGHGIYDNGWNRSPDWTIYFCGHFENDPASNVTYIGTDAEGSVKQDSGYASSSSSSTRVGGLFTFQERVVTSRVGISWISTDRACQNVQDEIPHGTKFASVVEETKEEWNSVVLSKITTSNTTQKNLELLYTSLYFMHLIPTNQTGENPSWSSSEPYYQDIFTFWDLFRCSTALMQVLQPQAYEEQIRSLIDIWRHEGFMPDARSSNYNGRTQGGSNADNILADAYVKGVRGAVNWEDGYRAMMADAETVPPNNPADPMAPDSSTKEGRGALPDWLNLGYITPRFTRAVSRAVEYAANDFGLYQVASGLDKHADAKKYLNRSRNWRNHWNPKQTSLGFSGFVVPRDSSGFLETDPLNDAGYWGSPYYEANSWAYSWAGVHDMKQLIKMMGGAHTAVKRLDTMLNEGASGSSGTIFDPTNEPMFNIPYLYNYAGRQDLSVSQSRKVAKKYYNTGVTGLPGNSDAGAMQTWLLWNMIGLYPITGQTTFLIHSPWFESLTIDLGNGKELHVTGHGGDGHGDSKIYVQSLKVNGREWRKNWLTWSDIFEKGGTLEFELGDAPSDWFTGELPPSPAS
ncbi:alpha-1,2-mannosidase family protein [Aspergillus clavatus NRRL 1]|uniref:Glycosyl hydrolase, family 92 protein n=1 Tax=Aspergillus clavatus (strain ATCC 1007 / CBS 513.65 / DSM 816 / NCTC 3887 / NRRL 1 / QM 1276 / 107) TaxID=344612 RepID=A1CAZ9_ASPCL|nr:glycosyl hydrolase, family 92 protein [Aspergillus clavatus NRRL 1]EAW12917.1 glycosyl hydrolase, family 92 protein [Aspergillus clavatus NRRL 1]